MPPSDDSVKRRSLVEQELVNSLGWLNSLRWIAGAGVVGAAGIAGYALDVPLPAGPIAAVGLAVLAYNAVLWWGLEWLRREHPRNMTAFEWMTRAQIGLDWAAMTVLIALSGGAESPAIIFFLFHITIASLLLPHRHGFYYVSIAPVLVGAVAASEYAGVLPHVAIIQPARYRDVLYVGAVLVFFAAACYVMAYCCMAIAERLRRRERELGGLYESVRDVSSTLQIADVLDRIVEAATRVLGCRAAAIRLLDPMRAHVEFAATCGLSERYRREVPEEYTKSVLDRDTLREGVVRVVDVGRDARVPHPEQARDEGIASMLSVSITGRKGDLGVLRAYGAPGHRFMEEDISYLQAVAAQGAAAIENAKAYKLLENLDRDKSQFLRITTHELRSPVRVTESLLMTLSDGYAGELTADQSELLLRAQRRLTSLHALIDDLLDLAAGKAQMSRAERSRVDVGAAVAEAAERFQDIARKKGIALTVAQPDRPLTVSCDPGDLERIVVNLVSNAVKYTKQGSVTVTLGRDDDGVRVEVADTGIGIPADARPHLFREFYRAGNAKATEQPGTGLGLSIVKLLLERYGGRTSFTSEEGKGTTIAFTIPSSEVADT